jgi:hypothetical protein
MNRSTLLERVKQHFTDLPMMMTACGGDERRRRPGDVRAHEFLAKPVDFRRVYGAAMAAFHRAVGPPARPGFAPTPRRSLIEG